jgi:hypothetical protein
LLGSGSKPVQLFGLRKTPDLSLAPRQALVAFERERAQIQRRAVGQNRPFAHSGRFCGHKSAKETVKTIAQGRPDEAAFTCDDYTRVLLILHTGSRVRRAPGLPCALSLEGRCALLLEGQEIYASLGRHPLREIARP